MMGVAQAQHKVWHVRVAAGCQNLIPYELCGVPFTKKLPALGLRITMFELRRGLALSDCPGMAHFLWRSSLLYKALQLCGMPFAGKVPGAGFTNYHLRPASWAHGWVFG